MAVLRKLFAAVLVTAGVFIISLGVRTGWDHYRARQVVHALMDALQQGDRRAALSVLEPRRRAQAELLAALGDDDWIPLAGLTWRVHHIAFDGRRAAAQLWIEQDGFVIEPSIRLSRDSQRNWQVEAIENLHVDPRWEDLQDDLAGAAGRQLAGELARALQNRPGVEVVRTTDDAAKR